MYGFKKQIEGELNRVLQLERNLKEYDKRLLKGTLVGKLEKNGRVAVFRDISSSLNGIRSRTRQLIGDSSSPLVREIAEARYLAELKRDLETDRVLLEKMLNKYKPYSAEDVFRNMPPLYGNVIMEGRPPCLFSDCAAAISAILAHGGRKARDQSLGDTQRNTREFTSKHFAITGEAVRSKNEALIYNIYHSYGVPFEFEKRLLLKNEAGVTVEVFPDYTIETIDGRIIIHEHAGLLADPKYRTAFIEKLGLYLLNGFTLWDDLFITADGPNGSIDTKSIDRMIKTFILPRVRCA